MVAHPPPLEVTEVVHPPTYLRVEPMALALRCGLWQRCEQASERVYGRTAAQCQEAAAAAEW
eukprot:COSAG05_NODE_1981_length_3754_cov_8.506156_3_plen_62_part_00